MEVLQKNYHPERGRINPNLENFTTKARFLDKFARHFSLSAL
jgi:hypothetical protein